MPVYDETIFEFDETDKAGLKEFLEINPNLDCIIKIAHDNSKEYYKKYNFRYYHSKILQIAF